LIFQLNKLTRVLVRPPIIPNIYGPVFILAVKGNLARGNVWGNKRQKQAWVRNWLSYWIGIDLGKNRWYRRYVKPILKGYKNDLRDAEAIVEAVQRPTMRFVALKPLAILSIETFRSDRSSGTEWGQQE
jgi:hypothetical protein